MRPILPLVLAIAMLTATLAESARAQDSSVYIATYIEVTANAVDSAAALLERYRDASRKADGNLDAHVIAAHTRAFRERLSPMVGALYDERIYNDLN
jgi:hypothetical protein